MMSGSVEVEIGEEVQASTILGTVGFGERSSQPHLHVELQRRQEEALAPYAGGADQGGHEERPGRWIDD